MKSLNLFFTLVVVFVDAINTEAQLYMKSDSQCICPGGELIYECTVEGDAGATFWTGTAFDCPETENQLEFVHRRFLNSTRACNNGAIVGRGIRVEGSNYTSQLNITVDPSMDGKTITCLDSSEMLIGNSTIILTTVSFPPPTNVSLILLTAVVANSLTMIAFKWSPVTFDCASIGYIITFDCGYCPNTTTNTEVVCTGIVIGTKCTFTIQTEVCGTLAGNITTIHLKLKVPDTPVVSIIPTYSHETSLLVALTIFLEDEVETIIDIINGLANSIVKYSLEVLSSSGEACFSANTSASLFSKGVYRYSLDISSCIHSSNVDPSLRFSATNVLGAGSPCNKTIGGRNKFINVSYDQDFTNVKCTFLTWPHVMSGDTTDYDRAEAKYYTCSIAYGINKSAVTTVISVDSVVLLHLQVDDISEKHRNFTVTASCDNYIIHVDGTFTSPRYNVQATSQFTISGLLFGVVVGVMGIVIIVAVTIAIFTTIMACLRKPSTQQLSTHEQSINTQETNTQETNTSTVQAVPHDQINTERNMAYETVF